MLGAQGFYRTESGVLGGRTHGELIHAGLAEVRFLILTVSAPSAQI